MPRIKFINIKEKTHNECYVSFVLASTYFSGQLPAKYLQRRVSLTSVFGMGTGGPSPQSTPTILLSPSGDFAIIPQQFINVKHFFKKFLNFFQGPLKAVKTVEKR